MKLIMRGREVRIYEVLYVGSIWIVEADSYADAIEVWKQVAQSGGSEPDRIKLLPGCTVVIRDQKIGGRERWERCSRCLKVPKQGRELYHHMGHPVPATAFRCN